MASVVVRHSSALVLFSLVGCVAAPPGPRGPLLGNGIQAAGDFSVAFSSAQLTRADGLSLRGTSDHHGSLPPILPQRLELRMSPVSFLDFGADVGWLDGGADLRFGRWAKPWRAWAGHLAFGVRSGTVAPIEATKSTESGWGRIEAYPLVCGATGRLLLSVGASVGRYYHEIEYRPPIHEDDSSGYSAIPVVRRELRVEMAFGYHVQNDRLSLLFAVEPYVVADAGPPRASACGNCEAVEYAQAFGVVLVLRGAVHAPFERADVD